MDKITEITKIQEELKPLVEAVEKQEVRRKRVCIMGFAPSWTLTPFDDPTMEVWTLNEAYKLFQQIKNGRADRWFEIHSPDSPSKNTKEHTEFLRNCKVPIFMQEHYDDIPMSVAYPREEIKEYFNQNFIINEAGSPFTEYSNSISWMVALAIYEWYEEIWITGVDMAQQSEYQFQRPSCNFFIGYAAGKGIKVLIPRNSELCKFPQDYGFDTDNQVRLKKKTRKNELKQRKNGMLAEIENLQRKMEQLDAGVKQLDGAIGEINYDLNNHIV